MNDWPRKKLGDLCDVLDNIRKPVTKRDRVPGPYPYYGATGVQDYVTDYLFDEPLILVGEDGAKWASGEHTAFAVKGKCWVNNHAHVLRPHRNTVIDNWLIYHLNHSDLSEFVSGLTVPKLNQGNLREIPIPVPPLREQRRIVAILDEAFSAIAKAKAAAEKNLANARELFESYLNRVFTQRGDGWEERKIPEICVDFGRGKSRHRPRNEPSLYGGSYPFIQTGDISNADHVIRSFKHSYSEKGLEQSKLWPKETVGIAIVGATIGETGVLNFEACFPDSVIAMNVDRDMADPYFIEYMLCNFIDLVKSQGEGSARDNINLGTFDKLTFPMPSASEQNRLVTQFQRVATETKRLETIYKQKLANLDELKQSLLQKAFTGQLTAKTAELEMAV